MGLFWVVEGLFWVVVGGNGFILGSDGFILLSCGWWWVYLGRGESLWMVVGAGTDYNPFFCYVFI